MIEQNAETCNVNLHDWILEILEKKLDKNDLEKIKKSVNSFQKSFNLALSILKEDLSENNLGVTFEEFEELKFNDIDKKDLLIIIMSEFLKYKAIQDEAHE